MIKLKLTFVLLFLISCSGLEFVYDKPDVLNKLRDKTEVSVSGNESSLISSYLLSKLNNKNKDSTYRLKVASAKYKTATIIEKDATASKYKIEYNIEYRLQDTESGCLLFKETIFSEGSFDSKSAGYSFGTDFSEKELMRNILHKNIDEFLKNIESSEFSTNCKNES